MRPPLLGVLRQLGREGLVDPEGVAGLLALGSQGEREAAPWFVRVLVGFGAWVASAFLCLFMFMFFSDLLDGVGAVVLGALLLAGVIPLRRAAGDSDFLQQVALAGWLVAQLLVLFGMAESTESVAATALVLLVVQAITIAWFPDAIARFLAAGFAVAALAAVFLQGMGPRAYDLATLAAAVSAGLLWWRRPAFLAGALPDAVNPVGYGLLAAAFGMLLLSLGNPFASGGPGYVTSAVLTVGVLLLAAALLGERVGSPQGLAVLGSLLILGAATAPAPGVMAAVGALLLGFRAGERALQGMAWLFLLVFLAGFYYHLEVSLLEKSGILAGSGLLLLGLREVVRRWVR